MNFLLGTFFFFFPLQTCKSRRCSKLTCDFPSVWSPFFHQNSKNRSFPSSQECDPDWDVSDLKWELERRNKIPEAEQRLLLDTRVLSDKVGWDGLG